MAEKSEQAEYTAAHGRRFALTVGAAFLVIAAVLWWRQQEVAAGVLGSVGGSLALAGLAIPARLRPVERAWMSMAHLISRVTTPLVMGGMYLLVLFPVGVLRRALGGNPLVHEARKDSYWFSRGDSGRRSNMQRQF